MGLPSPDEVSAMMNAEAWQPSAGGLPSPSEVDAMMAKDGFGGAASPSLSPFQDLLTGAEKAPSAISSLFSSIPSIVGHIATLPEDVSNAAVTAGDLGYQKLFGDVFAKDITPEKLNSIARLNEDFRAVGATAAQTAGFGVAGPAGGSLMNTLFNKANQFTGVDAPTTLEQDVHSTLENTGTLGVLGLAGDTLGGAAKLTGDAIRPPDPISPELAQAQSIGLDKISVAKAARKYLATDDGVLPLDQVVNGTTERGVFTGEDASPTAIQARNNSALSDLAKQVHGEGGILPKLDEMIANKELGPMGVANSADVPWWQSLNDYIDKKNAATTIDNPPEVLPPSSGVKYPKALAFIAKDPDNAIALTKQLQERAGVTETQFDPENPLSSLSRRKSALQGTAYNHGDGVSKQLDQKISQDIRQTIVDRANEAVPGLGDKVNELNSDMQEHYILQKPIQAAVDKLAGATYKAPKVEPPPSILKAAGKAALGGGVVGTAIDYAASVGGVPAPLAIASAVLGGGKAALENPAIARPVAGALSKVGDVFSSPITRSAALTSENKPVTSDRLNELMSSVFPGKKMEDVPRKQIEAKIDSNPFDSAVYEAESSRNPKAKNPDSSAAGAFQLTAGTAKALGVTDPLDFAQNYAGFKKLTAENAKEFGNDPALLYSAHVLGSTLLKKVQEGKPLTAQEKANVAQLEIALPRFMKIYQEKVSAA